MSDIRFFLTPGAIQDFREIYAAEGLTRAQALKALDKSVRSARLEHTQPGGSQVLLSQGARRHFLLVGQVECEQKPVLAVASVDDQNPKGWWLPSSGLVAAPEAVVGFGPHPGAELRLARETLGLSLQELSSLLGMPSRRLEAWERGQIKSWKTLRKVARLVGKLHETRILARASGGSPVTPVCPLAERGPGSQSG